ncbi:MAG: TatD family hydrolase, partial [Planctomycetota bacterium]
TEAEEKAYQWQLQFAKDHDMVVMVHSPHRDKKRGIIRSLDVAKEVGIDMEKLVIDHNNEETVEDVLDAGAWAAFTIYPHTKMGSQRMVDLTKKYGAERFIVDSSCDWGVSDPLSVPKTAKMMLDQGVPAEAVEQATWGNAAKAYGYSGQIDMDALGEPVVVDQRELFSDNSVLRGQPARVDDGVPN